MAQARCKTLHIPNRAFIKIVTNILLAQIGQARKSPHGKTVTNFSESGSMLKYFDRGKCNILRLWDSHQPMMVLIGQCVCFPIQGSAV